MPEGDGKGEMANAKTRLDMEHGFMKSIIRNQINRDNYDKEVKALKANQKTQQRHTQSKQKKPEIKTYVPPSRKQMNGTGPKLLLFKLEYEDQHKEIHHLQVFTGDDPSVLARKFGHDMGLNVPMTKALSEVLRQEINKRQASQVTHDR